MKFTVAITALLSLNQAVQALGVPCELCTNFDASLPIDMGQLDVMLTKEGPNGNLRRNLQMFQGDDEGEMELTSCAQVPAGIEFMGSNNIDAGTCSFFELIAMLFCNCDGACSTCPDGSAYPDLDAIPDYDALTDTDMMDMGSDMTEQPGTCRELVTQMGAMSIFLSTFEDTPFVGNMDENVSTLAPSELDLDMTAMVCGVAGLACGCPKTGCPLCDFGLENPEFIVENDDDDSFTCAKGVEMLQTMGPMGMCNEAKIFFDDAGCLCKEQITNNTDIVVDDKNTTINDTTTVEITNETKVPSETPNDTSADTSSGGYIFALSHSTVTITMLLAIFSICLFV